MKFLDVCTSSQILENAYALTEPDEILIIGLRTWFSVLLVLFTPEKPKFKSNVGICNVIPGKKKIQIPAGVVGSKRFCGQNSRIYVAEIIGCRQARRLLYECRQINDIDRAIRRDSSRPLIQNMQIKTILFVVRYILFREIVDFPC